MSEKLQILLRVLHYNLHSNDYSIGNLVINKHYHSRTPSMEISKIDGNTDKDNITIIEQERLSYMIESWMDDTLIENVCILKGLTIEEAEKILLEVYDLPYVDNEYKDWNGPMIDWLLIRNEYTHGKPIIDIGIL